MPFFELLRAVIIICTSCGMPIGSAPTGPFVVLLSFHFPTNQIRKKDPRHNIFAGGDGSAPEGIPGKSYKNHRKRGIELLIRKITKKEWKTWILEKPFSWKFQKHTLFSKSV